MKDDTPAWVYLAAIGFMLGVITGLNWLWANLYSTHTRAWDFGLMMILSGVYCVGKLVWSLWKGR